MNLKHSLKRNKMKTYLFKMSLCFSLISGLSTSSFFLPEYLTNLIAKNEHNEVQLNFAIEHKNIAALNFALKHTKFHSQLWLTFAKTLAKTQGDVAYQLALYYQKTPTKKVFWLKHASTLGYHQATLALAQHYFELNEVIKANEIVATIPTTIPTIQPTTVQTTFSKATSVNSLVKKSRGNSASTLALAISKQILITELAITQGKTVLVENSIKEHAALLKTTPAGAQLLNDIETYQIIANKKMVESNKLSSLCENSIQLFATSLTHLKQAEQIIEDFKYQPLNNAICFAPVRYMPIDTLECSQEQDTAIRCDESKWALFANTIETRYVGIMLPKGGANVHLGMLYFDSQDTVDVVAHEVTHLLGFVDEYPLRVEHITCNAIQKEAFSQNIAVLKNTYQGDQQTIRAHVLAQLPWSKYIKKSTPILHSVTDLKGTNHWQLGTPKEFQNEIGLFNAQTCDNSNMSKNNDFSAYKGVYQQTQLQYFSLSFPPLYSLLLKDNYTHYKTPSFHYNIALAYFQKTRLPKSDSNQLSLEPIALRQSVADKKNIEQANYWLEQAAKWEKTPDRIKKIRQGNF